MLIYTANDPIPWFQQMHKESPVYYDPDISFYFGRKGAWQAFRHADVQKGMSDPELFSREYVPRQGVGLADGLGMTDPPRHSHLHSVISKAFVSTAISPIEGWIRQQCEILLEPGLKEGKMDFINDFAHILPIKVINHILGVPEQYLQQTLSWVTRIGGDPRDIGPDIYIRIQKEMIALFTEVIENKKQAPQDDLITYLLNAKMEGEELTMNEVISFCMTIFTGGAESTTTLLGNAMLTFAERPGLQEHLLAHPGDIPNAILEVLRFRCPVLSLPRIARQDLELSGQQIRKGDLINFWIAGANLDPEIFPSPAVFDIRRDNARIMTFGHGIYHCLGRLLAKLEAKLAFETVFRHLRNIRVAGENVLTRIPNIVFFRFQSLLITLDAA
jgi:cytochrome P450